MCLHVAFGPCVGLEPFTEGFVQGLALGPCDFSGAVDEMGGRAEGDVFHTKVMCTRFVQRAMEPGKTGRASPAPTVVEGMAGYMDKWRGVVRALGSWTEGDGGHEAAGGGALFAVGEEEVGVAGGAEVDGVDVFWPQAGG